MFRVTLFVLLLCCAGKGKAYHIVGGDFTAEWAGGNNFEITLKLFRDCAAINGSGYDQAINVAVYDKITHVQQQYFVMHLGSVTSLQYTGSLCSPPPQVCVEEGAYIQTVTLPDNPNGYYLIWERCCRNSNVVNLISPDAAAMAFYLEIADPALHNSSPVFLNDPLPYMCLNQPFNFNFFGNDIDGDSISYAFEAPLDGGHTSQSAPNPFSFNGPGAGNLIPPSAPYSYTQWLPGYNSNNIINGNPTLSINAQTGQMHAVPINTGLYAMAVVMYEWRQGVIIGKVRREIEFVVINCTGNVVPNINTTLNQGSNNVFSVTAGDTLLIDISASDLKDSLFITHAGNVFSGSGIMPPFAVCNDTAGVKQVSSHFFWVPTCHHVSTTPYNVTLTVADNGCPLPSTQDFNITIWVLPQKPVDAPVILCIEKILPQPVLHWAHNVGNNTKVGQTIIYRSVNGAAFLPFDTLKNKNQINYTDTSANQFQNNYCYYLTLSNECGTSISFSDTLCTHHQINDDVITINQVSVLANNQIIIQWKPFNKAAFNTICILKRIDGIGGFVLWKQLSQYLLDSIIDYEVNTQLHTYSYIITNLNACNIPAAYSNEGKSMLLTGFAKPHLNAICFTHYTQWAAGIKHYEIYRKDDGNLPYQLIGTQSDTSFLDYDVPFTGGQFLYLIKAISNNGDAYSYSNTLELNQQPDVFVPNAFSPNGDGVNDLWRPTAIFVNQIDVWVFNHWGDNVFTTNSEQIYWDGTKNNKICESGIYTFKITYSDFNGGRFEKKGTITLLK